MAESYPVDLYARGIGSVEATEVILDSVPELLDANLHELGAAEFRGSWELFTSRNKLIEAQACLRACDKGHIRELTRTLAERFPFDYRTAYLEPGVARLEAVRAAFSGAPSPTPFLPVALFVLAFDGEAGDFSEDELSMVAGYSAAAILQLGQGERHDAGVAGLLRDICRVLRDAGQYDLAECIAEQAVGEATRLSASTGVRAELLDAQYDARCDKVDREAPVSDAERLAAARRMLAFIDDCLAPAVREFNEQLRAMRCPDLEIHERELALQHRRLTWETAESMAQRNWPKDATAKWLGLAKAYASAGAAINEANALSCALDELTLLVDRGAPYRLDLEAVLDEYVKTLEGSPWRSEEHRRGLLRRAAVAELSLGRTSRASLDAIYESLRVELAVTTGIQRDFVLSSADDYLGLAIRDGGVDGKRFGDFFELLRGAPLSPPLRLNDATVLRLFLTRLGSAVQVSANAIVRSACGENAHELARGLADARRLAQRDVDEWLEKKAEPTSAPAWQEILTRFVRRIGLAQVTRGEPEPRRALIELDGLGVHIPMAGPLIEVWPGVEALALARLGFDARLAPPALSVDSLVLSGFKRDEPWDQELQAIARTLRVPVKRFDSPARLQEALKAAPSFVVIGAHGLQDGVAGQLRVEIAGKHVPIEDAIGDVLLPIGATVVCATCFAGSGQGATMDGWLSMPECILRAGARTVVANRWPVWADPTSRTEFTRYLLLLRTASVALSGWEVPKLTTTFMKQLRQKNDNPRQWAGWGAWLAPATLVEPDRSFL